MSARVLLLLTLLAAAAVPGPASAMKRLDIEEELRLIERGQLPRLQIPDARYRVAVFTFEDPDSLGLGNAVASLLGHEILLKSEVGSIGVLRYEGGLSPSASESLSYFDKVEKVTEAQHVTLAAWGMVRRSGGRVLIDTYVQLPPEVVRAAFHWRLRLPARMGGGELWAHLRPDRMLVQHRELSEEGVAALAAAARRLDEMRAEPRDSAPVVATIPVGSVYWVERREGEWIEMNAPGAGSGWVRVSGHCPGECAPLLDAARFGSALLGFMESRAVPEIAETLAPDARAVCDQIAALEALGQGRAEDVETRSLGPASRWLGQGPVPPGGAAFANAQALARVAIELKLAAREGERERGGMGRDQFYDQLSLDPARVRAIAFDLAQRSLNDPRNLDVLHNLAILFGYAGDTARAQLALELKTKASKRGGE